MQEEFETLPHEFRARIRRDFAPDVAEAILAGMTAERRASFRVNRLHPGHAGAVEALRAEGVDVDVVPDVPDAFSVPAADRARLLESAAARQGMIYVQNAASQLPPHALTPEPGERVLDLAAAPGSKTLQLAALMAHEGEIAAVELVRSRFFRMNALLTQYGATNVRTFLKNGMDVWRHRPEHFDRVLLDAPCASEGRFIASDPESFGFWNPRKVREMVRKQRRLLFSAIQSLRPGGVLVYSTCSLSFDENEGVLSDVFEQFEGALESEPLPLEPRSALPAVPETAGRVFHPETAFARRIVPDDLFEGFFLCRIRKTRSTL